MSEAEKLGERLYQKAIHPGGKQEEDRNLQAGLLKLFRKGQDYFVRLDWQDTVVFPQEAVQNNLRALQDAAHCLEKGNIRMALEAVYRIDNSRYAFLFDEDVYQYFTEYVLNQPEERLQWGAGRIVRHENLYHLVKSLKRKEASNSGQTKEELEMIKKVEEQQKICYDDDVRYMTRSTEKMIEEMKKLEEV